MKKILLTLLPLTLILSGCSSDSKKVVQLQLSYVPTCQVPVPTSDSATTNKLVTAAKSMDNSMDHLAQMHMATNPIGNFMPPLNAKKLHMTRLSSISWNGPMLPLVERIAHYSHYRLRVLGNIPTMPVIVNLNEKSKPLADVLRNIQYQVYNRAKIVVFPATSYIEVRYVR